MSHDDEQAHEGVVGFPRVSGDEPNYSTIRSGHGWFSPRERG